MKILIVSAFYRFPTFEVNENVQLILITSHTESEKYKNRNKTHQKKIKNEKEIRRYAKISAI